MKRTQSIYVLGGAMALTLAVALAGCGGSGDESAPPAGETTTIEQPADNTTTGDATTDNAAPTGAEVGSEQAAGSFQVTLTMAPAAAKVGDATFQAKVTRDDKPVEDAQVKLDLSMPTMDMGGPDIDLKHTTGGLYEGSANLSMGGYWQADVIVTVGDESGTAVYGFTAMQE